MDILRLLSIGDSTKEFAAMTDAVAVTHKEPMWISSLRVSEPTDMAFAASLG